MPPSGPPRLVVDTNIFVSAFFSIARGRRSLERNLFGRITGDDDPEAPPLLLSTEILEEYEDVFYRPEFRFDPKAVDAALQAFRRLGHLVRVVHHLPPLPKDPDDTKFLECAEDGDADYLVTRNKRHFPDLEWIVTAKEFFEAEYPEAFE